MYKSLTFLPRAAVEDLFNKTEAMADAQSRVLISMSTPFDKLNGSWCRPAKAMPSCWRDVLFLQFHDCDNRHIYHRETVIMPIDDEQAYEILRFLKKHQDDDAELYINCEGGQSRSAGVAVFARDIYGLDIWKIQLDSKDVPVLFKHPVMDKWNRRVHSTLVRLYGLCLAGKGKIPADELPGISTIQK